MSDVAAAPGEPRLRARWAALPWPVRVLAGVAVGVVVVALVAGVLVGVQVRRPLPQTTGTIDLPGLSAPVEVVRDDQGVPQLYGSSVADLAMAQGYVHAQERFFEMDVRRHVTAGRLSELVGEAGLETDAYVRTMGWRRVAAEELGLLDPDTRELLQAYADGVNAYLDGRSTADIAVEYTVLSLGSLDDYVPEEWTPVDSLAWLKAMAWDLRGNMDDEVGRVLATAAVGADRAAQLYPSATAATPIVTQGAVVDGVYEADATQGGTRNPTRPAFTAAQRAVLAEVATGTESVPALLGLGDGIGSNSVVVSGDLSATGAPLLADDPHLGVSVPGVWMQMGLHCTAEAAAAGDCALDVAGFTFSGFPGVIIGHNASIAWGFTNLGADVSDLYVEKVRGDRWLHGGRWRRLRTRTETLAVAGGDDVEITVRSTAHGPLLSDVSDQLAEVGEDVLAAAPSAPTGSDVAGSSGAGGAVEPAVALRWTALDPQPTADAVLAMDLADDWDSFRAAAASFAVPAQNLVYADTAGHIGYQAPGVVPIRKSGNDGRTPARGWLVQDDWTDQTVPFDGLPSVLDPDEGFVVTANQRVVGEEYPYFLTDDWDQGYRSDRMRTLLAADLADGDGVTLDDLAAIQLDTRHPMAAALVPYLLDADLEPGYDAAGQALLGDWDLSQPADGEGSAAAAYFNAVWARLLADTFDDELPEAVRPDGSDRWVAVVTRLLRHPRDAFWDDVTTDEVETRDDVLQEALLEARDDLTRLQSRDARDWTWGHQHRLDLVATPLGMSGIGAVEALVNRGGWEVGGGSAAVDASSWDASTWGASGEGASGEGASGAGASGAGASGAGASGAGASSGASAGGGSSGAGSVGEFTIVSAPSMRMLVSLADLDDSRWINLTGVSGHPGSAHYTDQTDLWARGETLPFLFSSDAVHAAAEDVLTLQPAD
ncbi:penicillin acylase family protein [Nocardioides sp. GY 10127]|uniref:penicillin acylase family protein n=1 Tax=Nocardioides sp. GY 10127 TaxID=2569762 RepID=UPI0010A7FB27|nr:penicillin acylase family protein [Nocardioides sp. GY 10127]TIC79095.1 penicillin acylase family protein [Nocardioides sp. GY 10127]